MFSDNNVPFRVDDRTLDNYLFDVIGITYSTPFLDVVKETKFAHLFDPKQYAGVLVSDIKFMVCSDNVDFGELELAPYNYQSHNYVVFWAIINIICLKVYQDTGHNDNFTADVNNFTENVDGLRFAKGFMIINILMDPKFNFNVSRTEIEQFVSINDLLKFCDDDDDNNNERFKMGLFYNRCIAHMYSKDFVKTSYVFDNKLSLDQIVPDLLNEASSTQIDKEISQFTTETLFWTLGDFDEYAKLAVDHYHKFDDIDDNRIDFLRKYRYQFESLIYSIFFKKLQRRLNVFAKTGDLSTLFSMFKPNIDKFVEPMSKRLKVFNLKVDDVNYLYDKQLIYVFNSPSERLSFLAALAQLTYYETYRRDKVDVNIRPKPWLEFITNLNRDERMFFNYLKRHSQLRQNSGKHKWADDYDVYRTVIYNRNRRLIQLFAQLRSISDRWMNYHRFSVKTGKVYREIFIEADSADPNHNFFANVMISDIVPLLKSLSNQYLSLKDLKTDKNFGDAISLTISSYSLRDSDLIYIDDLATSIMSRYQVPIRLTIDGAFNLEENLDIIERWIDTPMIEYVLIGASYNNHYVTESKFMKYLYSTAPHRLNKVIFLQDTELGLAEGQERYGIPKPCRYWVSRYRFDQPENNELVEKILEVHVKYYNDDKLEYKSN